MKKIFARALCDSNWQKSEGLSLNKGDILKIISNEHAKWWRCELNGKVGYVRSHYLEVLAIQLKTQKFEVCLTDIPHEVAYPLLEKRLVADDVSLVLKNYRRNRDNGSDNDKPKTPFLDANFSTLNITGQSNDAYAWPDEEGRYWWKITLEDGSVNEEYYWTKDERRGWPDRGDENRYWFIVHHALILIRFRRDFCSPLC